MISLDSATACIHLPPNESRWYAVHTGVNQEKNVGSQLELRGIEYFLPLYQSARRWSDRRVVLDLPLFPGYLFVHILLSERLRVLQIPRVAHLVGFQGQPMPLRDEEVDILRRGVAQGRSVEPHPYLVVGRRVRVIDGPFEGAEGVLVRRKNSLRVVVSLELLMRSISIEIDEALVEPVASRARRLPVDPYVISQSTKLSHPAV